MVRHAPNNNQRPRRCSFPRPSRHAIRRLNKSTARGRSWQGALRPSAQCVAQSVLRRHLGEGACKLDSGELYKAALARHLHRAGAHHFGGETAAQLFPARILDRREEIEPGIAARRHHPRDRLNHVASLCKTAKALFAVGSVGLASHRMPSSGRATTCYHEARSSGRTSLPLLFGCCGRVRPQTCFRRACCRSCSCARLFCTAYFGFAVDSSTAARHVRLYFTMPFVVAALADGRWGKGSTLPLVCHHRRICGRSILRPGSDAFQPAAISPLVGSRLCDRPDDRTSSVVAC